MTELIEVLRTTRKVGSGDSKNDIVHEHAQFFTPEGKLLCESCTLDAECEWTKEGKPFAPTDSVGGR